MSRPAHLLAAAAAGLVLTVAALAAPSVAQAAPSATGLLTPTLVCTGSTATTYSPGITDTARPVAVRGASSFGCTGVPAATSATASTAFTSTLSCTDLLQQTTGTKTITWSKGGTSVFSYTRTATRNDVVTVITFTGTVTSGQYAGSTVVETAVAPNVAFAACSTTAGLTALRYTETLTVTGLLA